MRASESGRSPTSRATSSAATPSRSARYVFVGVADAARGRRLAARPARRGDHGRAVGRGAGSRHAEPLVHVRRAGRAGRAPRRCWRRSRRTSARGWPRAPSSSATSATARPRTGSRGWAPARRTCSSRSTRSTHARAGAARARLQETLDAAGEALTVVHEQRSEALPEGRTTSASRTASPSRRWPAAAPSRVPATGCSTPTAAGASSRPASSCSATTTRTAACRWRRCRRSTATRRTSSTARCRCIRSGCATLPARSPTAATRTCWRPSWSGAGRTARRWSASPHGPDAVDRQRSGARQRLPLRRTTRTGMACPIGAHVRRANPRDHDGFFDGKLSDRHRIIRRGRAYGPALAGRRARGRRGRPRADVQVLPGGHRTPVRDDPVAAGSTTATRSASATTRTRSSACTPTAAAG